MHYVTDENGEKIATLTLPLKVEFRLEDVAQLAAGACVPVVAGGKLVSDAAPGKPIRRPVKK